MKIIAKQLTTLRWPTWPTYWVQLTGNRVTLSMVLFRGAAQLWKKWQKISAVFMIMIQSHQQEGKSFSKANVTMQIQKVQVCSMTAGPAVKLANKALEVMLLQTPAAVASIAISLIT